MAAQPTFPETTSNGIPLITVGLTQVPRFVSEVVGPLATMPGPARGPVRGPERKESKEATTSALSEAFKL